MKLAPSNGSIALIWFCAALFPACAVSFPFVKESSAMTSDVAIEASAIESKPDISDVGQRFLKLIEGLKTREDLDFDRVQRLMKLPLEATSPSIGGVVLHRYFQPLGDGWEYLFQYIPETSSTMRGVGLFLVHENNEFSPMTRPCKLDFQHYHDALQAMGFTAVPLHDEIGRVQSWRYSKYSPADGRVSIALTITPQNIVPGEDGPLCVKSIATIN